MQSSTTKSVEKLDRTERFAQFTAIFSNQVFKNLGQQKRVDKDNHKFVARCKQAQHFIRQNRESCRLSAQSCQTSLVDGLPIRVIFILLPRQKNLSFGVTQGTVSVGLHSQREG